MRKDRSVSFAENNPRAIASKPSDIEESLKNPQAPGFLLSKSNRTSHDWKDEELSLETNLKWMRTKRRIEKGRSILKAFEKYAEFIKDRHIKRNDQRLK